MKLNVRDERIVVADSIDWAAVEERYIERIPSCARSPGAECEAGPRCLDHVEHGEAQRPQPRQGTRPQPMPPVFHRGGELPGQAPLRARRDVFAVGHAPPAGPLAPERGPGEAGRMFDELQAKIDEPRRPRTCRKVLRNAHLAMAKSKRRPVKKVRSLVRVMLCAVKHNMAIVDVRLAKGLVLVD